MTRLLSSWGRGIRHIPLLVFLAVLLPCGGADAACGQVTLLVPSQPGIEKNSGTAAADAAKPAARGQDRRVEKPAPAPAPAANGAAPAAQPAPAPADPGNAPAPEAAAAPAPDIGEEVDVLLGMLWPFTSESAPMEMPQMLATLRFGADTPVRDGALQPERRDLLGDVEEIRFQGVQAWGANVALSRPGLYQFLMEARPWWDGTRQRFEQHYVKTEVPVHGVERGWDAPAGQHWEIVPQSRPFGLTVPCLFAGEALLAGKPLAGARVRMVRVNVEKRPAPTPWHEEMVARTNAGGGFAFVLNRPGWWCCVAETEGAPLKGPDGRPKPLTLGALFWLYVDGAADGPRRR